MERKTTQLFNQQTTSASKALWPARTQRCVASHTVQRHRKIFLRGLCPRWLSTPLRKQRPMVIQVRTLWPDVAQATRLQFRHIVLALTIGCAIPLLCSLYTWSILPVLGALAAALTLVISYQVLLSQQHEALTRGQKTRSTLTLQAEPAVNNAEEDKEIVPTKQASVPTRPLLPFPDTPMPVPPTPLIRVLETIDLSSSDVEHFLDIPSVPNTSLGTPVQETE